MRFMRRGGATLTHIERRGLKTLVNLADGHVRRKPVVSERPLLESLQDIYALGLQYDPVELEDKFVNSYLALSGQKLPSEAQRFVFFSASEVINVVSRVLAECKESCAVLEPTFDNIPMIIESAGVPVYPFGQSLLHNPEALLKEIDQSTALFVVLPNNPTGLVLSEDEFRKLCDLCAKAGKGLIVDACLRLYVPSAHFNYYKILSESGVDWMVIEDTGKVWATNDLKAGVLVCSDKYASGADKAFHDLVLSISPFVLALLWQLSERGGSQAIEEIQDLIHSNREILKLALQDSDIFSCDDDTLLPMMNIFYDKTRYPNQQELLAALRKKGLAVLGSEGFYWSSTEHKPFLRLALSRDEETIRQGVSLLATFQ